MSRIEKRVNESSLGTRSARAARASVSDAKAAKAVQRVAQVRAQQTSKKGDSK